MTRLSTSSHGIKRVFKARSNACFGTPIGVMSDDAEKYNPQDFKNDVVLAIEKRYIGEGLGTLAEGVFVPCSELGEPLRAAFGIYDAARARGATRHGAMRELGAAAESMGVTLDETRGVIYAILVCVDGVWRTYIGQTTGTCAGRRKQHGRGRCRLLNEAIESAGSDETGCVCFPIFALPRGGVLDANQQTIKDALTIAEVFSQRFFGTVGTPLGLNYHYGNGKWGGLVEGPAWIERRNTLAAFWTKHKRWPKQHAEDDDERKLARWHGHQRCGRESLSKFQREALESIDGDVWNRRASRTQMDAKIDAFEADQRGIETGGLVFSTTIKVESGEDEVAVSATDMRKSYNGAKNSASMTPEQRKRVEESLPGLTMTSAKAFRAYMTSLYEKHVRSYTPTAGYGDRIVWRAGIDEKTKRPIRDWLGGIMWRTTTLDDDDIAFFDGHGLGMIPESRMTEAECEAFLVSNRNRSAASNSRRSASLKRKREDERKARDDALAANPIPIIDPRCLS